MADIFISYASEDRSRVDPLAKALEDQGWSVWWAPRIPPGKTFFSVIKEALEASKCVVVLWSKQSINSEWVLEEANIGKGRGILVPAKIDSVDPPLGFGLIQAADLTDWETETSHAGFLSFLSAISDIVGSPPQQEKNEQSAEIPELSLEQPSKVQPEEGESAQPPPSQPEPIKVKPPESEPDVKETTEIKSPEPRKPSKILKLAALAGLILLLIAGIWWWVSHQEVNEVRQEIEKISRQALELENAVSEINKAEQIEGLQEQRDTLSQQVSDFRERAAKAGFRSELEDLQKRLERVQIQLANKEKELITALIGMKFVLIPAGKFVMGSPPNEFGRINDERQHEVIISKSFYLQTTEVSQAQWERIMGDNPSEFKNCGDYCPVERITWDEAQKFIKKLNQMEGTDKYRLPTEAEWEYACRAKTETAYSFGDEVDKLGQYAWYQDNSKGQTHPVGKKKPNAWGLYDMLGNVWEWCQDWYGDYPSSSVADPKGPDKGEYRVMRGGSWSSLAGFLRSANRYQHDPVYAYFHWSGFRVARDL